MTPAAAVPGLSAACDSSDLSLYVPSCVPSGKTHLWDTPRTVTRTAGPERTRPLCRRKTLQPQTAWVQLLPKVLHTPSGQHVPEPWEVGAIVLSCWVQGQKLTNGLVGLQSGSRLGQSEGAALEPSGHILHLLWSTPSASGVESGRKGHSKT